MTVDKKIETIRMLQFDHFDGRTAFASLSFTQKPVGISEAGVSVYAIARENKGAGFLVSELH